MKIGIIGAGVISQAYLTSLCTQFPWLKVSAISDNIPGKAAARLQEMEKAGVLQMKDIRICSTDELLQMEDISLVIVLTPMESHYSIAKSALLAGKHVYTEKTLTATTEQAAELAAIANKKGLWLGAAPDTFLGTNIQTAQKAVDDGLIGEVQSFSISVNRNNDVFTAMFPFLRTAGSLRDYAVYYLTALVAILGPVAKVSAFIRAPYKKRVNQIPNTPNYKEEIATPKESVIAATLELENGIIGTFHQNHESVIQDQANFAIYGRKAILLPGCPNFFGADTVMISPKSGGDIGSACFDTETTVLPPVGAYAENSRGVGAAEMAKAIEAGTKNRASKELAMHVLAIIEAMEKSNYEGTTVQVLHSCERPEPFLYPLQG